MVVCGGAAKLMAAWDEFSLIDLFRLAIQASLVFSVRELFGGEKTTAMFSEGTEPLFLHRHPIPIRSFMDSSVQF